MQGICGNLVCCCSFHTCSLQELWAVARKESAASAAAAAVLLGADGIPLAQHFFEGLGMYVGEAIHHPSTGATIRQGVGQLSYANGDVYKGHWHDDLFEGEGEMTYADGRHYTGGWHRGVFNGQGAHRYLGVL